MTTTKSFAETILKLKGAYTDVLYQIARHLDQAQQQEHRSHYSISAMIPVREIEVLQAINSLIWEDVRKLKESLLTIQQMDVATELSAFEIKRDVAILFDFYVRKRLGLDLCHRSDSVETTAEYLLTEIARDEFDITRVKSLVESSKSIRKVLNNLEEETGCHKKSSPWGELTMLVVIAGEIIVEASANKERRQNQRMMKLCSTAADKFSSRIMSLGSWVS